MFRRVTIGQRFGLIIGLLFLFLGCVILAFTLGSRSIQDISVGEIGNAVESGQKDKLKAAVSSMVESLRAAAQGLDEETAKEAVRAGIKNARFEEDASGYYFVYDTSGVCVAHPLRPEFQGQNRLDNKDTDGKLYIKELIEAAEEGGGFVDYYFNKPGQNVASPKIGYAELIPGTSYVLATAVYVDIIEERKAELGQRIESAFNATLYAILGGLAAALVFIVLPISLLIIRSIVSPVREATAAARKIADGELDTSLAATGKDEVAQLETALNEMVATLSRNLTEITAKTQEAEDKAATAAAATQRAEHALEQAKTAKRAGMHTAAERLEAIVARVSESTNDVAERTATISDGASQQNERIQTTATAMGEMNATVLEVARNAGDGAALSEEAASKATEGADVVSQNLTAMRGIEAKTTSLKRNMDELGKSAEDIGSIMTTIEDIADQTNLLALNAAIEAARAGDAGRGFAVVADEVRKLAEKTMGATKEVAAAIGSIQRAARENVAAVDETVTDITRASQLSDKSGDILREIVNGSDTLASQVQSIATAAEEQSAASEEINQAVEEIRNVTLATAQEAQAASGAVSALREETRELIRLIESLKAEE